MKRANDLNNIEISRGRDGYWLSVKTSTGKSATYNLDRFCSGEIQNVIKEWAEEQLKDLRMCDPHKCTTGVAEVAQSNRGGGMIPTREALASLCHSQWSGWMQYLFSKCEYKDGNMIIPKWAVGRWMGQMNTHYEFLSEAEQQNDRDEADKFITLLQDLDIEVKEEK